MKAMLVGLPVRCTQTGAERKSLPAAGRPLLREYRLLDAGMIKFLYPVSSIYANNTLKFLYNKWHYGNKSLFQAVVH
jgi:hypothetical protein